jgi:hypothetical protein
MAIMKINEIIGRLAAAVRRAAPLTRLPAHPAG